MRRLEDAVLTQRAALAAIVLPPGACRAPANYGITVPHYLFKVKPPRGPAWFLSDEAINSATSGAPI
jgi:hypothetical protein